MNNRKKIGVLAVILMAGATLVSLGSRSAARDKADAQTNETDTSFLTDAGLSDSTGPALGNGELFGRMMLSVGIVAVLAVAAFYVSKKVLPKVTNAPGKEIRVVETTYLGPRKMLHLVQVGNQKLLVGSTNETIATLAHIDEAWLNLSKQEIENTVNL